jgi:hypothetical protein
MIESTETIKAVFYRIGEGGIIAPGMLIETRNYIMVMRMRG